MRLVIRTEDVIDQKIVYHYVVFKHRKSFIRWLDKRNGYMVSDHAAIFSHFRACKIILNTLKLRRA